MPNNDPNDAFLAAVRFQGGPSWDAVLKRAMTVSINVPLAPLPGQPQVGAQPSQAFAMSQPQGSLHVVGPMVGPEHVLPGTIPPIGGHSHAPEGQGVIALRQPVAPIGQEPTQGAFLSVEEVNQISLNHITTLNQPIAQPIFQGVIGAAPQARLTMTPHGLVFMPAPATIQKIFLLPKSIAELLAEAEKLRTDKIPGSAKNGGGTVEVRGTKIVNDPIPGTRGGHPSIGAIVFFLYTPSDTLVLTQSCEMFWVDYAERTVTYEIILASGQKVTGSSADLSHPRQLDNRIANEVPTSPAYPQQGRNLESTTMAKGDVPHAEMDVLKGHAILLAAPFASVDTICFNLVWNLEAWVILLCSGESYYSVLNRQFATVSSRVCFNFSGGDIVGIAEGDSKVSADKPPEKGSDIDKNAKKQLDADVKPFAGRDSGWASQK